MADTEQQVHSIADPALPGKTDKVFACNVGEQQVHGMADPALLDKIDKLFACNAGEHIDLPQLVVIGDQSSGKSSVLEGLTELPFPRDSGLCTRFATQITFRRAPIESISVSIIASADATPEHVEKVEGWHMDVQKLDAPAFAGIMKEVPNVMGLSTDKSDAFTETFSGDVLRLEIHGPHEEHLSVIDVPGIFENTAPGLTTKRDIMMVREMVQYYMDNARSVMIAVVPANVDIATQEILEMAREFDLEGHRTIGVFTKPDLVDRGAEASVIDLLHGKGLNGKLGWSVVRNPGQQQLMDGKADRKSLEDDFFRYKEPWKTIDKDRVGMTALRKRLQQTLTAHIRREFPKVKMEINKKLSDCRQELAMLGAKRETKEEQRSFLLDIASRFQELTSLALAAQYGGHVCFKEIEALRLPTLFANRNDLFSQDLHSHGHKFNFESQNETSDVATNESRETGYVPPHLRMKKKKAAPIKVEFLEDPVAARKYGNHDDIEDVLSAQIHIPESSNSGIMKWLENTYTTTRGNHLGTFNPALLSMTMYEQSAKWKDLAMGYTSDIVAVVHDYVVLLLTHLCADENVRSQHLATLLDGLVESYRKGLKQAKSLLEVEREGTPLTVNHFFNENLEKNRQMRRQSALSSKVVESLEFGKVVRLEDLTESQPAMTNTTHIVREMHDILLAYYKVACKRFVDTICMQAADYYLVSGPESPLRLFGPNFVMSLTEDQLEVIAGEDAGLRRRRRQLTKEIKDLEAGRKILL
ncbi:MAG: hypothetical protein M1821_005071 [Bathelium mastoideum]|nr:MAG: hypothetical protein M1821_005071 [Bathelium mastoideum]